VWNGRKRTNDDSQPGTKFPRLTNEAAAANDSLAMVSVDGQNVCCTYFLSWEMKKQAIGCDVCARDGCMKIV